MSEAQPRAPPDGPEPASGGPSAAVRRTRFVCISDTHNSQIKLPRGDVLIHAGDLTNQGSYPELARTVAWLEKADFECKIVVAGNHDVTLDRAFYGAHGDCFHSQSPESPDACISLLASSPTITYLCHEAASVCLEKPDGPRTRFTIFGSPYSPRKGTWAFSYERTGCRDGRGGAETAPRFGNLSTAHPRADSRSLEHSRGAATDRDTWSAVPADTDVLVTHTPPFTHCDWSTSTGTALGCEELQRVLARVRPRLAVCGHVHEARGSERVRWKPGGEAGNQEACASEEGIERWEDPGQGPRNGKLSVVDLTSRRGQRPLDNDGSVTAGPAGAPPDGGGRRETCVVNCALVATNHPHVGGKRFNKPVVVDLDLPVWDGRPD